MQKTELNNSKLPILHIPLNSLAKSLIYGDESNLGDDDEEHNMSPGSAITMNSPFNKDKNPRKAQPSRFQSYVALIESEDPRNSEEKGSVNLASKDLYSAQSNEMSMTATEREKLWNSETTSLHDENLCPCRQLLMSGLNAFRNMEFTKAAKYFTESTTSTSLDSKAYFSKSQALENLGRLNEIFGKYDDALKSYQAALKLASETMGSDHIYTAQVFDRISHLKIIACEYSEAEKYAKKAFDIRTSKLSKDDPQLAQSYNTLATCQMALGKYQAALELIKIGIKLFNENKDRESEEGLLLAGELNFTLGCIQFKMLTIDNAYKSLKSALDLKLKILRPEHPLLTPIYNQLIITAYPFGAKKATKEFISQALKSFKLCEDAVNVQKIKFYNNLALVEVDDKSSDNAFDYAQMSYDTAVKLFKENHLDIGNALTTLANISISRNQIKKGITYLEQSLLCKMSVLGPFHPDLIETIISLASAYVLLEDEKKAIDYVTKKLDPIIQHYTGSHPIPAMCYHGIGYIYFSLHNHKIALDNFFKAFKIFREVYGSSFWINIEICEFIGHSYRLLGDLNKAVEFYKFSIESFQRLTTEDDSHLIESYVTIALAYQEKKDYSNSRSCLDKAISLREKNFGKNDPELGPLFLKLAEVAEEGEDGDSAFTFYEHGLDNICNNPDFGDNDFNSAFEKYQALGNALGKNKEVKKYKDILIKKYNKKSLESIQEADWKEFSEKLEEVLTKGRKSSKRSTYL